MAPFSSTILQGPHLAIATFAVLVAASLPVPAQTAGFRSLVFQGDPSPDGNGTLQEIRDGGPALNNNGRVVFRARSDTADTDELILAMGGGDPAEVLVRSTDDAPDANGTMGQFDSPTINAGGTVAFRAFPQGTVGTSTFRGIFRAGGELVQISRGGEPAGDGNGFIGSYPDQVSSDPIPLNASGQVAFQADIDGSSGTSFVDLAIYRGSGGPLTEIVRVGRLVDGSEVIGVSFPTINDAGQVATKVSFALDDFAIVRGDGTAPTVLARSGGVVPGGNGSYHLFRQEAHPINSSGAVAFVASLTGTSGGGADNSILVRSDGNESVIIARKGEPAPRGGTLNSFAAFASPALNDGGQVAWESSVEISPRVAVSALLTGDGDSITEMVREGDAAPGGGTFSDFGRPSLNGRGDVVFEATLAGTSADRGLFLYQASSGSLVAMLRIGDEFEGSSIDGFDFLSLPHFGNGGSGLNDLGQIAVRFDLADGRSGVAVTDSTGRSAIEILEVRGGPGDLTLSWTVGPAVDLYRSTDLTSWGAPIATGVTTGSHTDTEAPAGRAFYVIVPAGEPFP